MKLQILHKVKVNGKDSGLLNYRYLSDDDQPISAIFQGSLNAIVALAKSGGYWIEYPGYQ